MPIANDFIGFIPAEAPVMKPAISDMGLPIPETSKSTMVILSENRNRYLILSHAKVSRVIFPLKQHTRAVFLLHKLVIVYDEKRDL
jgi:hypothetical protein